MPAPAPKPLCAPVPPSRFEQFCKRNIVGIAICAPLAVFALIQFAVALLRG